MIYALAFLSIFVVLYICGRYDETEVRESWSDLVCLRADAAVQALQTQIHSDAACLDYAHQATAGSRRTRAPRSLLRDVEAVAGVVARIAAQRIQTLRGMRVCSRMLSAVLPQPPLDAGSLALPEASRIARAGAMLHALIVGTDSRFRWRAQVSEWIYGLVCRVTGRTAARLSADGTLAPAVWQRFDQGVGDVRTLDAHHLETVRVFASSLEIFQRHGVPVDEMSGAETR